MNHLKRKLNFYDGLVLSLGSLIGSGLLFLPSYTYALAGNDAFPAWIIATLLCIPIIYIMKEVVARIPNESGLQGWVELGLGKQYRFTIPVLMLATVSLGMPAAACIAAKYVCVGMGISNIYEWPLAIIIVVSTSLLTLKGCKLSTKSLQLLSLVILLLVISIGIYNWGNLSEALESNRLTPAFDPGTVTSAIIVIFWAYAGFENMTFLAGEFEHPERDIPLAIAISLIVCCCLYFALTVIYASSVTDIKDTELVGLLSIVSSAHPAVSIVIGALAFATVMMNFISWITGISRMVYSIASKCTGFVSGLSVLNSKGVPHRAVLFITLLFSLVVTVYVFAPEVLNLAIQVVSSSFVVIYLLVVMAYFALSCGLYKKGLATVLFSALVIALFSLKWLVLYPLLWLFVSMKVVRTDP